MTRNAPAWIGLSILAAAGAYLALGPRDAFPGSFGPDHFARLASSVALLIVIGGSVIFGYRGHVSLALRQMLAWLAIGLVLVVVYTYRHDFARVGARVLSELVPGVPIAASIQSENGTVAVMAGSNGHFEVEALVNGTNVRFLADTGASVVVLTEEDALRIGIDLDQLRYAVPVQTANGSTTAALVHLENVSVGTIEVDNVRALVARPDQLATSLLGMSFLSRLSSFQIRGDQLVLED